MANQPINIQIINLPQIRSAFKKSPELMVGELNKAIFKVLQNIRGKEILEYRSLGIGTPTTSLINSISQGIYQANLKGEVGPNVTGHPGMDKMKKPWHGITHYAFFVHGGTKYMSARPFLFNAVTTGQRDTDAFFIKAVDNVLSAIGKSI